MNIGKLYRFSDKQFVTNVNYRLYSEGPTSWWGELIPVEYGRISDGGDFTIELEDNRKSTCYLKKLVNRAVSGIPPRYVYRFEGRGSLEYGTGIILH